MKVRSAPIRKGSSLSRLLAAARTGLGWLAGVRVDEEKQADDGEYLPRLADAVALLVLGHESGAYLGRGIGHCREVEHDRTEEDDRQPEELTNQSPE